MARTIEGKLSGEGARVALVVSRYNSFITGRLLDGAMDAFLRHGVSDENVTVAWCPGSFELPFVARRMAQSDSYDAVVCCTRIIESRIDFDDRTSEDVGRD